MQRQRGILSNVLNEGFRELQKLERHLGELQMDLNEDPSKRVHLSLFSCRLLPRRIESGCRRQRIDH